MEIWRAWSEKIVGTAEYEHRKAEEQKSIRVEAIQATGQFESRLAAITAAPGDWFAAVRSTYEHAIESAQKIYEVPRPSSGAMQREGTELVSALERAGC